MALVCGCAGWRGYGDTYYGHSFPRDRARAETTYSFGMPGDGWRPLREDVKDVQVAWIHPDLAGLIEVRATCDEQGDSSLHQYTDHIRIDWTNWNVVSQTEEHLAGRAALRTVVEAQLDGIPRKNELVVLKKNGCLFDLRYSTHPSEFERGRADFQRVVEGFRFPVSES